MAKIVRQAGSLYNIGIKAFGLFGNFLLLSPEFLGDPPAHLSHLKRVRQAIMENVRMSTSYNLCHLSEPPKRRRIDYTVPIPLSRRAIIPLFGILGVEPFVANRELGRFAQPRRTLADSSLSRLGRYALRPAQAQFSIRGELNLHFIE